MILAHVISAILIVESQGNPAAIGDGGAAHGPYQIHQAVLDDVNRRYHTAYTTQDCYHPARARRIAEMYLMMWCGPKASAEKYARVWNGGPTGHRKLATVGYWAKVKKEIQRNRSKRTA